MQNRGKERGCKGTWILLKEVISNGRCRHSLYPGMHVRDEHFFLRSGMQRGENDWGEKKFVTEDRGDGSV